MKKEKGISPLIAAVILIAATMIIAGILAAWTSKFVSEELERAAVVSGGAECFGAQFELHSGSYDGTSNLKLILDNKKSIDLELTNLFLILSDNTVETKSLENETLKGNEIKTITVPNVSNTFLTGEIKTHCPDVSVYFTKSQVA
jgi:flagellin-like protein